MKRTLLLVALAFCGAALAQGHGHGSGGGMQGTERAGPSGMERRAAGPQEEPSLFDGEVRGVDRSGGTVRLKHGAIRVLDVPAATAAYAVKDAALLDRLNVGDRVRFTAVLQGRTLLVTKILPAN